MTDLPPIANFLSNILIIMLVITFLYALSIRFASDQTLYDLANLPSGDPQKIVYTIEPSPYSGDSSILPSVFNIPEIYVTIVIPSLNEERLLSSTLDEAVKYLISRQKTDRSFTWEIIIVDDFSKDETSNISMEYARRHNEVHLLRLPSNMGKGAAVQMGSLHSRGKYILTVDADGETKIDEFGELERKMKQLQTINKEAIIVGSRAHILDSQFNRSNGASKSRRSFFQMKIFQFLNSMNGVGNIQDTGLGFKLFSREAARWLFPNQHVMRYCFETELLAIGRMRNMQVAEVAVEWNPVRDSSETPIKMVQMALTLMQMALFYNLGLWTIRLKAEISNENEL